MNKIIFAAALLISGVAFAEDHAHQKATETPAPAAEEAKTEHMADHSKHMADHSGHMGKMSKQDAEKACKSEKAKDMKKCVEGKTHAM